MNSLLLALAGFAQNIMERARSHIDFLAPLLLRIYLVPVFWVAANNKWNFDSESSLDGVIQWFEHGLGLPLPALNAYLAWGAEYFGAICLALGLAIRWLSIPLMVTMIVAATTVHWENGWQAVHDPASPHASVVATEAIERLSRAKSILQEHGHYEWLTEHGNYVVSNNGIEWAATYFVMLLALFVLGGGRFISLDYWIKSRIQRS